MTDFLMKEYLVRWLFSRGGEATEFFTTNTDPLKTLANLANSLQETRLGVGNKISGYELYELIKKQSFEPTAGGKIK